MARLSARKGNNSKMGIIDDITREKKFQSFWEHVHVCLNTNHRKIKTIFTYEIKTLACHIWMDYEKSNFSSTKSLLQLSILPLQYRAQSPFRSSSSLFNLFSFHPEGAGGERGLKIKFNFKNTHTP